MSHQLNTYEIEGPAGGWHQTAGFVPIPGYALGPPQNSGMTSEPSIPAQKRGILTPQVITSVAPPAPLSGPQAGVDQTGQALSPELLVQYYHHVRPRNATPLWDRVILEIPRITDSLNQKMLERTNGRRDFVADASLVDGVVRFLGEQADHLQTLPATVYNAQVLADRYAEDLYKQLDAQLLSEWRYDFYIINARDRMRDRAKLEFGIEGDRGKPEEDASSRLTTHFTPGFRGRRDAYLKYIGVGTMIYPVTTFPMK